MSGVYGKRKRGVRMKQKSKKLALLGLCTAAAMVLSYVESLIPLFLPGLKIGLPNVVIVFVLYQAGWLSAAGVSLVRVGLVAVLFGNTLSLAYSFAGAVLSLLVMGLLKKVGFFSAVGVSVAGGVSHNGAQIAVAAAVMRTNQLLYYLPALIIGGTIAGVLIGIAGGILLRRLPAADLLERH